jgi:hypothetical protein
MSAVAVLCMVSLSLALKVNPTDSDEICYKYKCKSDEIEFEDNQCVKFVNDTFYLDPCGRTSTLWYCDPVSEPVDSFCYNYNLISEKSIAGEPCKYNDQCLTALCTSGICYGSNEDESCKDSSYCNPGFYCKNNKCAKQIAAGMDETCTQDYECVNNAGCNGGKCVEYMSLEKGSKVDTCDDYFNIFCEKAACKDNVCISAPISKSKPKKCSTDSDCKSETNGITSKCRCGHNSKGYKYCDLLPGDSEYKKYLDYISDWIQSSSIYNCNTLKRLDDSCPFIHWDIRKFREYQYYANRAKDFPLIQGSDECSMEIYNGDYYSSRMTYDHDDSALHLSLLLISLILALF